MPSVPAPSSVNCVAIFDAVNAERGVLFVFALDVHKTLSLILCDRPLAKEESCRESSWVGARTNALGSTERCGWGGTVDEGVSSDDLR